MHVSQRREQAPRSHYEHSLLFSPGIKLKNRFVVEVDYFFENLFVGRFHLAKERSTKKEDERKRGNIQCKSQFKRRFEKDFPHSHVCGCACGKRKGVEVFSGPERVTKTRTMNELHQFFKKQNKLYGNSFGVLSSECTKYLKHIPN